MHHLATFAGLTGAHVYVVHTSSGDALREAQAAHNRGVQMWVETVIPYLVLDRSYAEKPNFEGAKYVMSPPLREKRHQDALWNALRTGLISTVATDHAPFDFKGQKEMGRDDFTKIPNGIPSVEDRVNLLYTYGVRKGRIDLHRFVDAASTQAAQTVRPVPAQRHDSTRQRRRPGDLRPGVPRHDFRQDAADERRLQRLRRLAARRPAQRGHRPRQSASPRRQIRRRPNPRANVEARTDAWVIYSHAQ